MSLFDKLKKAKAPKEEAPKEETKKEDKEESLSLEEHQQLRKKLKGILYSDDLVEELLPVFEKLYPQEGFEQVFELLEAKETELNNLNDSKEYFNQESEINTKTSDDTEDGKGNNEDPLMKIMEERYPNL